jgi:diguanylate cyclase (GGDEF)-like protein
MTSNSHGKSSREVDPGAMKTVVAQPQAQPSRTKGILTIVSGSEAGKIVPVTPGDVVTLGRSEECTMRFEDTSLSRVHARVMYVMNTYMLGDAGSTNGTFVNDERISKAAHLEDGDRILLGTNTVLRFSLVSDEEEEALRRVYEAAVLDALTGVANRKHLEERLEAELAFAVRHDADLSVIIADLDHFKRVNDTYGHLAGDEVLKCAAQRLKQALRTEDFVGRYGGEEFLIVARGTPVAQAVALADRLRARVSSDPIVFAGQPIVVTMSAGIASLADCGPAKDRSSLLAAADERLYLAKERGRNRVVGPEGAP